MTGRTLAMAIKAFWGYHKAKQAKGKYGKQSIKSLTKQGASLDSVEISGENIGSFKKVARKYNIGFALRKDSSVNPPNWIVFFKAKDSKALESAFKEFTGSVLKHDKSAKPLMLDKLKHFKELANSVEAPAKDRSRGEIAI